MSPIPKAKHALSQAPDLRSEQQLWTAAVQAAEAQIYSYPQRFWGINQAKEYIGRVLDGKGFEYVKGVVGDVGISSESGKARLKGSMGGVESELENAETNVLVDLRPETTSGSSTTDSTSIPSSIVDSEVAASTRDKLLYYIAIRAFKEGEFYLDNPPKKYASTVSTPISSKKEVSSPETGSSTHRPTRPTLPPGGKPTSSIPPTTPSSEMSSEISKISSLITYYPLTLLTLHNAKAWIAHIAYQKHHIFTYPTNTPSTHADRESFRQNIFTLVAHSAWSSGHMTLAHIPDDWTSDTDTHTQPQNSKNQNPSPASNPTQQNSNPLYTQIASDISTLLTTHLRTWPRWFATLNSARDFVAQFAFACGFVYTGFDGVEMRDYRRFVCFAAARGAWLEGKFVLGEAPGVGQLRGVRDGERNMGRVGGNGKEDERLGGKGEGEGEVVNDEDVEREAEAEPTEIENEGSDKSDEAETVVASEPASPVDSVDSGLAQEERKEKEERGDGETKKKDPFEVSFPTINFFDLYKQERSKGTDTNRTLASRHPNEVRIDSQSRFRVVFLISF